MLTYRGRGQRVGPLREREGQRENLKLEVKGGEI